MRQAVILAAGEGQRLRPFTVNKPKGMLFIAGKPILQYVIEALAQNGVRDIVMVVGYKREQIFDCLGSGEQFGVDIVYINQEKQLGTAHALTQVQSVVGDEFLVLPGDNLIEAGTIADFVNVGPSAMLLKEVDNPLRYGVITIEDGLVKQIEEKPEEITVNTINTGIYAFSRDIFQFIGTELNLPDVIQKMLAQGCAVGAFETEDTWLDIVYPWDILSLNNAVLRHIQPTLEGTIEAGGFVRGLVVVGKDSVIRSGSYIVGPVIIGSNCDIGPGVSIMPSTSIGDNVLISPFTEVRNSAIGADVTIGPGSIVQDSVIDEGCTLGGHFTACSGEVEVRVNDAYHGVNVGAMIGAGCSLGYNVVAQPGVIVGCYSQVQASKVIHGKLPDRSTVF